MIHGIRQLYVNPNWDLRALVVAEGSVAGSLKLAFVFVNSLNNRLSKVPPDPEFLRGGVLDEAVERSSKFLSGNGRHRFNNWWLEEQPKGSTSSLNDYLQGTNRVPFLDAQAAYHEVWDPRWQRIYHLPFLRGKIPPRLYQTGVALIEMTLDSLEHAIGRNEALIASNQEHRRKVYNGVAPNLAAAERRRLHLRSLMVARPVDPFG